ncbi:hypothetical protein OH764_36440 (plasmid) [Burkholderia sp. M6-3]
MLAGNPAVVAAENTSLMRLLLEGGNSPQTLNGPERRKMPAFANRFTDAEIGRVLSFVRRSCEIVRCRSPRATSLCCTRS